MLTKQGGQAGIGKGKLKLSPKSPFNMVKPIGLIRFLYDSEITAQLLLHGIQKVIIVARSEEKYNTAYDEWRVRKGIYLTENDGRVTFIKCDLGDINDVYAAAEKIKQQTEVIHILICNAGTPDPRYNLLQILIFNASNS